jgi:hypothetical protein
MAAMTKGRARMLIYQVRDDPPNLLEMDKPPYDIWFATEREARECLATLTSLDSIDELPSVPPDREGRLSWQEPNGTRLHLDCIELPTTAKEMCDLVNDLICRACGDFALTPNGDALSSESGRT